MKGYFSVNSPAEVRRHLRRSEVLINGIVHEGVIACDTEMGYAICLIRDDAKSDRVRYFIPRRDPAGYNGHWATELRWGEIIVRPREAGEEAGE